MRLKFDKNFVFPVYVHEAVIKHIIKLSKSSELEIFGYLSGNIFQCNKKLYIIIEDHLFIEGSVHGDQYSTSQIEGTAGNYEKAFEKLKLKRKNENLRIVGWWHSHPGFTCFLSNTDIDTQKFFFPESYQVAMVVDPMNDELAFFTLENDSVNGYKEIAYAVIS